jgi:hypothetical protein
VQSPIEIDFEKFLEGADPHLAALYFQYGRYLLISSSRAGTQRANLQGALERLHDATLGVEVPCQYKYRDELAYRSFKRVCCLLLLATPASDRPGSDKK